MVDRLRIDKVLFATFHGGSGSSAINNVGVFDDDGTALTMEVLQGAPDGLLSELRGIAMVSSGVLWVASGSKNASVIAAFEATSADGYTYNYTSTVAQFGSINSLWHPFDFTIDASGHCFVSNQDTNVVARLVVGEGFQSADAAPLASGLPSGTFLAGTFVASSNGDLPGVPATTVVATPAGLEVSFDSDCKVANSVRGVAWTGDGLYVADEVANVVKIYDANGNYQAESNALSHGGPVHLLVADQVLYVSDGYDVYSTAVSATSLDLKGIGIKVPKGSGMAIGTGTDFYIGSRDSSQPRIYRYKGFPSDPTSDIHWKVGDLPEFLMYLPGG